MGFIGFWTEVFWRSFADALSLAQSIVFVAVAVVGLISLRWPRANNAHEHIVSGRVAIVLLIALVCARVPFAIYNMWEEEHNLYLNEHELRIKAEAKADAAQTTYRHRTEVVEKLKSFIAEDQALVEHGLSLPVTAYGHVASRVNAFCFRRKYVGRKCQQMGS